MENLFILVKIVAVCIAAGLLGNWFSEEVKNARRNGYPVYRAYYSIPGIIIIVIIVLFPILAWWVQG